MADQIEWEQRKILMAAMQNASRHQATQYIATSKEITNCLREVAINKWDFRAKQMLEEIGLKTDKDVHFAIAKHWPYKMIEDPDRNCPEYDNVPIIL